MEYEIITDSIQINTSGNPSLNGYLARPASSGNYPGIIVCMEIFGVTKHIREISDRIARQGYIVFAPNFYWREHPHADLPYDTQGRQEGMRLMQQLNRKKTLEDMQTAIDFVSHQDDCNKRIGTVGFSLGGHIAYLAATKLDLRVAASLYGGWIVDGGIPLSSPEPTVSFTAGMAQKNVRFLGIVGGRDHLISSAEWSKLGEALSAAQVRHELVVYPEAKHGFFCDHRDDFDPIASNDTWKRLVHLLTEELKN
jgi:carboxymethylenebutenolidase